MAPTAGSEDEPIPLAESVTNLVISGIEEEDALKYANTFQAEGINENTLAMLDKDTLEKLGVDKIGHRLAILKFCKVFSKRGFNNESNDCIKPMPAKAPLKK